MTQVPNGQDLPPTEPEAEEVPAERVPAPLRHTPPRTKTGSVWVGLATVTLFLVILIVFIAQNTGSVAVRFLGWKGRAPLSVALLIAAVVAALFVLAVGTARIAQLRKAARREARISPSRS